MPEKIKTKLKRKIRSKRNDSLFDTWSVIHFASGVLMGWLIAPFVALALMVLWEPFEIFVLSPILKRFGIIFGFESLRNSLSDIFFDTLGVATGAYILAKIAEAPFHIL